MRERREGERGRQIDSRNGASPSEICQSFKLCLICNVVGRTAFEFHVSTLGYDAS